MHHVPRPFGMHSLGEPLLTTIAARQARAIRRSGGRVLANGGNLDGGDVTWVHYVHAAYEPVAIGRVECRAGRRRVIGVTWRPNAAPCTHARLVVCNSERTVHDVVTRVGVDPGRVRRVYYGIDACTVSRSRRIQRSAKAASVAIHRVPVVLFVGALGDRRKGFDTRLRGVDRALSQSRSWDAHLLVAGSGAELDRWRRKGRIATGWHERITFLGYRTDVPALIAAADVMVHPARYEAYGLGGARSDLLGRSRDRVRVRRHCRAIPDGLAPTCSSTTPTVRPTCAPACGNGATRRRVHAPDASVWRDAENAQLGRHGARNRRPRRIVMHAGFVDVAACWVCGGEQLHARARRDSRSRAVSRSASGSWPRIPARPYGFVDARVCGFAQPERLPALPGFFDLLYDQLWSRRMGAARIREQLQGLHLSHHSRRSREERSARRTPPARHWCACRTIHAPRTKRGLARRRASS